MDSTRLIIKNQDLSTVAQESYSTKVSGFTVIRSPKGPMIPRRIPAMASAKMQDLFGKVSKRYPNLLEANAFNANYDLYVSAPYKEGKTTVPVAYITSKGIFKGTTQVPYGRKIEEYVAGEVLEDTLIEEPGNLEGILGLKEVVIEDNRYPKSNAIFAQDETKENSVLYFPLKSTLTELRDKAEYYTQEGKKIEGTLSDENKVGNPLKLVKYRIKKDKNPDASKVSEVYICVDQVFSTTEDKQDALKAHKTDGETELGAFSPIKIGSVFIMKQSGEEYSLEKIGYIKGINNSITVNDPKQLSSLFKPFWTIRAKKTQECTEDNLGEITEKEALEKLRNAFSEDLTPTEYYIKCEENDLCLVIPEETAISNDVGSDTLKSTLISHTIEKDKEEKIKSNVEYTDIKFESASGKITATLTVDYLAENRNYSEVSLLSAEELKNKWNGGIIEKNNLNSSSSATEVSLVRVLNIPEEDIYGTIFPKYPGNGEIHINFGDFEKRESSSFNINTPRGRNILNISAAYEQGAFHDGSHPINFKGSLNPAEKTPSGERLGLLQSSAYRSQEILGVFIKKPFVTVTNFPATINHYNSLVFEEGVKDISITDENDKYGLHEIYDLGWNEAKKDEYSDVDIFFESNCRPIKKPGQQPDHNEFFNVGKEIQDEFGVAGHELSGYIYNSTIDPKDFKGENSAEIDISSLTPLIPGSLYWNVCNEAIVELYSTGERFKSPLTGLKAAMQAKIIDNRYGGVAPMYLNSGSPRCGGQLGDYPEAAILNLRYKYNKIDQKKLDELNYNPIIRDSSYGIMSVGQKTGKDGDLTDWSYIGHACAFINFEKEVKNKVMIPQLGKANNDYFRTRRKEQVEHILEPRLSGDNRIWASAIVDTSTAPGVNDEYARNARKFIIDVKVKVDIFSEYVQLNFTNMDQGSEI